MGNGKFVQELAGFALGGQAPEEQFAENIRMARHLFVHDHRRQPRIAATEMVDPDRGVEEDQSGLVNLGGLRRGGAFRPGIVPPSAASRRRAMLWRISTSASRTSALVSRMPVASRRESTSSSSRVIVVRMPSNIASIDAISMHQNSGVSPLPISLGKKLSCAARSSAREMKASLDSHQMPAFLSGEVWDPLPVVPIEVALTPASLAI